MNRVLVASLKNEFQWLQNELIDFCRVIRNVNEITLLVPTLELVEANIVIILDSVVTDDNQLLTVVNDLIKHNPKLIIVFIHARHTEGFSILSDLKNRDVICLKFIDLEPGSVFNVLKEAFQKERKDIPLELLVLPDSTEDENSAVVEVDAEEELYTFEDKNENVQEDAGPEPVSENLPSTVPDIKVLDPYPIQRKPLDETRIYHVTRKLILVGSCDRGHGVSFICRNLAHVAGKMGIPTSLVEFPLSQPYHFDRSLMTPGILQSMSVQEEQEFQRSFVDAPYLISNGAKVKDDLYKKNGVRYIVSHPDYKISSWTDLHTRKLLSLTKHDVLVIVDIGVHWLNPTVSCLLDEADELLLVQLAEPARLERLFNPKYIPKRYFEFVIGQENVSFLINQYHKVPSEDFYLEYFNFPSIKHHYFVPVLEPDIIASCALNGDYEAKYSEQLFEVLRSIVSRWVPYEQKQSKGLFKRLLGGRKK